MYTELSAFVESVVTSSFLPIIAYAKKESEPEKLRHFNVLSKSVHHRFVRREREIAETKFEVAQVEALRYRQRVENLERELKEVQDSLNSEREKVQVNVLVLTTKSLQKAFKGGIETWGNCKLLINEDIARNHFKFSFCIALRI